MTNNKELIIISPQPDIDNYNYNYYITENECECVYSIVSLSKIDVNLSIFPSISGGQISWV